ncbi:uncharacterized protein BDCG_00528 [Blastomyces dermatitidis ER-3]|uniref:Uncharacterized protein n=1 Tax=Ajellomyces dermatitidis (strain ER-3 / ATCC MYA-2586) TaxID=559297 RepID=A0ABP2EPM4_AJEDR|nr:uncharacterized protein BDCG_00528 [Blastomyces dermatitidis ER-3]EEQ83723.2 hypothetical protein BDCG_00528 [Blastomyces dermatitidis ER-3]
MFSPNTPSPSSDSTSHRQPHRNSFSLPAPPAKLALPTGECRFILLHPSIPGQRCSCQGFRRNESRLGASCECGHQACYHQSGNMVNSSQVSEPVSPLALAALLERVSRLEEQHRQDRKLWEEELREERRARREDARVLREAMHSFYKFMEREVPQKFAAVDDKTDSLLDHVSRLEERIGIIDDSTMGLENRVADLEGDDGDGDGDGDGHGHGNHEDGVQSEGINEETSVEEDEGNPKRARRKWQTTDRPGAEQRVLSVKLSKDSRGWSEGDCQCHTSMAPPKPPGASQCHSAACISKSPKTSPYNPATDPSFPLELIDAHAPNTGAHTYVHRLTSPPRNLVTPLLSNQEMASYKTIRHATNIHTTDVPLINPPRPRSASARQDVGQKDSANQQQVSRAYPSPEEKGIGPYYELSNPPSGKRKLDAEGNETRQRPMFLPMPPPLSLSGPNGEV